MKLSVPFLYEALIIKPRCRKPTVVSVRDSVEVEIKELTSDELPVAFRVGSTEMRWDGQELWDFDYHCVSRKPPEKVALATVFENTRNATNGGWSCRGATGPFHQFWRHLGDSMACRHGVNMCCLLNRLDEADYLSRKAVKCREWLDDNRQALINVAHQVAASVMAVDGFMFHPVGEPRYVINTFGLGNNHGGTGMFVTQSYNSNISHTAYFSALDYDKAWAYANLTAARRGDNESVPVRPNGGNVIDVLIPEAVKVEASKQHGNGCEFINDIEGGINAGGPIGGMAVAFAGLVDRG